MCVSFEFSVYHFMQVYTLSLLYMLFKTERNKQMNVAVQSVVSSCGCDNYVTDAICIHV